MFANQSAGAIENSRLYHELEQRLLDLRKAHQKQKDDQETLMRMERLSVMGETSAIVAHELRNPLVAIGGFARTLLRNLDEDDPNRQFADIITEEVGRMETIIHDLLDFIRPQKRLRKEVVVDQLVAETADRFQARTGGARTSSWNMDLQARGLALDVPSRARSSRSCRTIWSTPCRPSPTAAGSRCVPRLLEGGVRGGGPGRWPGIC